MFAQEVSPPYGGSVIARSTEIAGGRSTNVTSVCQAFALPPPRCASSSKTLGLSLVPGTVGWAVVRSPNRRANPAWAASSRCRWPRRKTTLCSSKASLMTVISSGGRFGLAAMPVISAPMWPAIFLTSMAVMLRSSREVAFGIDRSKWPERCQ